MEGYRPSSCVFSGPAPSVIARILPTASSEHSNHVDVSGADQAPVVRRRSPALELAWCWR